MDPAIRTSIDSHSIWEMRALEDYVEREDRRQHFLIQQKASLFQQLRQKRRLLDARRALHWASTRTDGESHYIWHVGVLRYGTAMRLGYKTDFEKAAKRAAQHVGIVTALILVEAAVCYLAGARNDC